MCVFHSTFSIHKIRKVQKSRVINKAGIPKKMFFGSFILFKAEHTVKRTLTSIPDIYWVFGHLRTVNALLIWCGFQRQYDDLHTIQRKQATDFVAWLWRCDVWFTNDVTSSIICISGRQLPLANWGNCDLLLLCKLRLIYCQITHQHLVRYVNLLLIKTVCYQYGTVSKKIARSIPLTLGDETVFFALQQIVGLELHIFWWPLYWTR